MENTIDSKYHFPLLIAIPLVWIVTLVAGGSTLGIETAESHFEMSAIKVGILFTVVLGGKAFLYFSTRTFPLSSAISWFDIFLTLLISAILLYWFVSSGVVGLDSKALMSLGVGTWMLIQFFMGLNYFLVMFTKMGSKGNRLF